MAINGYQPIGGVASDNLFNPGQANNFYNNFNDASVDYSANLTQDQQRYNDLVAAYQYLSDPANQATLDQENYAGFSQYMLGQLQSDLGEQQNVVGAVTAQNAVTADASNIQGTKNLISSGDIANAQSASDLLAYANDIDQNTGGQSNAVAILQAQIAQFQKMGTFDQGDLVPALRQTLTQVANSAITYLTQQQGSAQTSASAALNTANMGFTLNSPDYQQEQNAVQNFEYGNGPNDPNSAVYQATQADNANIYDQVYNIKNGINNMASSGGVANSGERQEALSNANGQAIQAATKLQQNVQDQAQSAITQEQQNVANQQAQQTELQNQVKNEDTANLFNTATGNEITAYNSQTGAQNAENLANNAQSIEQQQQNQGLWNNIFGTAASGLGTLAGAATGGLI